MNSGSLAVKRGAVRRSRVCEIREKPAGIAAGYLCVVVAQPAGLCCRLFVSRLGNLPPG